MRPRDSLDDLSQPVHEIRLLNDVRVPMRDGVELSADVYLPATPGAWPVILVRTPYGNQGSVGEGSFFAQRGYAVVVQDTRGRHDSDGEWTPWIHDIADGADTVDWCGTTAWSNGNVGMIGGSYLGLVQWWAAHTHSPYLKTIIPFSAHADKFLYGMNYRGGAFKLWGNLLWASMTHARTMQPSMLLAASTGTADTSPLDLDRSPMHWNDLFAHLPLMTADEAAVGRPIDFYRNWLRHSSHDDFWKSFSNYGRYQHIDIPILQIGGWFDVHSISTIANVEGVQSNAPPNARADHRLVMGPWGHGVGTQVFGDVDFGADAAIDLRGLQLRWLDRWLKGIDNGAEHGPALRLFTMGTNTWRGAESWPLPETMWTKLHLRSGGRLTDAPPEPGEAPDTYDYDPASPVPTLSPNPWDDRPLDHRRVESRSDVLAYTTDGLPDDLEVTGPVQARLFASSSGVDTDWTVRLLDVHPDGRSIGLCDGILRARFRDPPCVRTGVPAPGQYERAQALVPGQVYEFVIEVGATSVVFPRGHRIRVHISSSNFPRFDRNLNTGEPLGHDTDMVVATQTIHHDIEHPSHLEMPVIRR